MKHSRNLIVTNIAVAVILLLALLAGWREAAAFGLAALAILDLLVLLRGRPARSHEDDSE